MLGHKASLSKFKETEIISSIFSDHNTMRIEINHMKIKLKKHKHVEAKQYATKKSIDHFRSQRKYLETNENKTHNDPKHMGCRKSSSKRNFIAIQFYIRKQT